MTVTEFKEVFLPWHLKFYRFAYRITGNVSDAEDLVQDTYLKLWGKRQMLKEVANLEAFATIVLRNECIGFLRTKKSKRHAEQTMEALSPLSVENRSVENADLLKFLRTAVETMPLQQRQVMLLRHWGDYSLTEIEELTGLSAANVRVLLSRGRKKLRELLTNEKL